MESSQNTHTKLLSEIREAMDNASFDLDHEASMVQARLLSPLIEIIEHRGISQVKLEEATGIKQSFISGLFNNTRNLSMKHIALLQKALDVVLQAPSVISSKEHNDAFYINNDKKTGRIIQMFSPEDAPFFIEDETSENLMLEKW